MSEPNASPVELLRLLVREARHHLVLIAAVFAVIAIGALVAGVLLPKQYESHAILLAESTNIIAPLMGGRAVTTSGTDDVQLLRQAFLTRRILREVHAAGGWEPTADPIKEARQLDQLARRISIQSPRRELIRLSYRDTDPRRCHAVASKLAEIYIRESTSGKDKESREAFEFIDRQVKEYAAKAEEAHAQVLRYTRAHGGEAPAARRSAAAARRSGGTLPSEQLAALSAEESSLAAELAAAEARSGAARRAERAAQLEREVETLLTQFTENHPSVKRARAELALQREEIARAGPGEEEATRALRVRLEQVRRRLGAASGATFGAALAAPPEVAPELRGVGLDATLSELVRRYESTREVYQDLLNRRETARLSMELKAERGADAVRVFESPEIPVISTGLRLMHLALLGLALAVAVPVGLLYALVRFDPRVRSPRQLERIRNLPLLVGIPSSVSDHERQRDRRRALLAAVIIGGVFAVYLTFFLVRVKLAT